MSAFAQLNADHLSLGLLGRLADRLGHLFGLALAEPNAALLVANDDKRGKAETLTTFNGFRNPVDRDQAVGEFGGFLTVAAVAPTVVFTGHCGLLQLGGASAPYGSIQVGGRRPRIIETAPMRRLQGWTGPAQGQPRTA